MELNDTFPEVSDDETPVTNVSGRCGEMDQNYIQVWNQCQWWCEGTLFSGIGLGGLIANLISIAVLSTKEMRKHSFNHLLIALAVFDILFILVSVPVYTFQMFRIFVGNQAFSLIYVYFLYPMSPVTLCASIYMTLAITVERYLAVCKPLLYRNLNTTMSSGRRVAMYVAPVAIVSVCLNIPKFMETQANVGSDNSTQIAATDMRLNPTYMLYYTISQIFHPTLTTGIIPMAALIYMNTSIFFGIRRTMAARNRRRGEQQASTENNLAIVLIGIVIMHIACHALRVFLAAMAVSLIKDTVYCMREEGGYVPPLWIMCGESVSSLLIMINFSGNFLIYCSVSTHFKAVLTACFVKPARGQVVVTNPGVCRNKAPEQIELKSMVTTVPRENGTVVKPAIPSPSDNVIRVDIEKTVGESNGSVKNEVLTLAANVPLMPVESPSTASAVRVRPRSVTLPFNDKQKIPLMKSGSQPIDSNGNPMQKMNSEQDGITRLRRDSMAEEYL